MEKEIKITFLTRFYPPHRNINGNEVREMVYNLEKDYGIYSRILTINRKTDVLGHVKEPIGEVIKLKNRFLGKNKISRFIAMLYDGYILCKKAKAYKSNLIIVTSSPPLLPFWASLMFRKKMRWAFWSLDIFPEGLAVSGYISEKNFLYKYFKRKTYKTPPKHLIALGDNQAKYVLSKYKETIPYSVHPCGVYLNLEKDTKIPEWYDSEKIILGYCGNVNDAHNPEFIKEIINHLNPDKHLLVLSLYGNKSKEVKDYSKNRPGVIVLEFVSRLDLIDIHLVSLRSSWTHIAVPSKAMSAISMGCSILFCGKEESDIWQLFKKASWLIDESQDIKIQVAAFIEKVTRTEIGLKKQETAEIHKNLKANVLNTYADISKLVS